jgi:hypothetical protein
MIGQGVTPTALSNFELKGLGDHFGACFAYTHQVETSTVRELDVYFLPGASMNNMSEIAAYMRSSGDFSSVTVESPSS